MKIGNKVPKSLIEACKRDGRITEICNEDEWDGEHQNQYWLTLADGWNWAGCGSIHECTVKDCINAMKCIEKGI